MNVSDWSSLFCSHDEWNAKKQKVIAALNKCYGEGFASLHGSDWIKIERNRLMLCFQERREDGRFLGTYQVQREAKFIGIGGGESVDCRELIYQIAKVAQTHNG